MCYTFKGNVSCCNRQNSIHSWLFIITSGLWVHYKNSMEIITLRRLLNLQRLEIFKGFVPALNIIWKYLNMNNAGCMMKSWRIELVIIVANLSEPHSNTVNSMVVHTWRTAVKNGIATHYYSLTRWFMCKQNDKLMYGYFPYRGPGVHFL